MYLCAALTRLEPRSRGPSVRESSRSFLPLMSVLLLLPPPYDPVDCCTRLPLLESPVPCWVKKGGDWPVMEGKGGVEISGGVKGGADRKLFELKLELGLGLGEIVERVGEGVVRILGGGDTGVEGDAEAWLVARPNPATGMLMISPLTFSPMLLPFTAAGKQAHAQLHERQQEHGNTCRILHEGTTRPRILCTTTARTEALDTHRTAICSKQLAGVIPPGCGQACTAMMGLIRQTVLQCLPNSTLAH